MKGRLLLGIPVLWLAAAACGGSKPPAPPPDQRTSEPPTAPSDQGAPKPPTTPPDQGAPQPPTTPPDQGAPESPTSEPPTSESPTTPPDQGTPEPPDTPPDQPTAKYVVHIDCAPVNDFGYIASAKGDLEVGERTADGQFPVTGTLRFRYELFGAPETVKDARVEGTIDGLGWLLSANVVSGAQDLESVLLVLSPPHSSSTVNGPGGSPSYQTDCTASTVNLPHGSDLVPDGTMSYTDLANGTGTIVQIFVRNIGNLPVHEPSSGAPGRMSIGSTVVGVAVVGGIGTPTNTLQPGERGYLRATVPAGEITRCITRQVLIDIDHTLQSGQPDPFGTDSVAVSTPCVRWSTKLAADSLAPPRVLDPFLVDKSLLGIVSSAQLGRKDFLCNHCHYNGSNAGRYAPPTVVKDGTPDPHDGSGFINSTDSIGDTSWAATSDGWANRFLDVGVRGPYGPPRQPKPPWLRDLVQQWIDDGRLP